MRNRSKGLQTFLACLIALTALGAGCAKKPVPAAPPMPAAPVAPPARPTVTLQASSTFIQRGDTVTLNWSSTNATSLTLAPGVGQVAPEGSTKVRPESSLTYTITATGPGGSADASARVTVSAPPPPAPPAEAVLTIDELFRQRVFDAFFDFDRAEIRPDARDALAKTAEFLRANPEIKINIEGHCDERGSTEYNLALGERRAQAARQFLIQLGVSADRMQTVSYGKERPFCTESSEECWQNNRRAHFVRAK